MHALIDLAFSRSRAILLTLAFILLAGVLSYLAIPKESEPDIAVPIIYVSMTHDGISPEDAERLLVRPMEKELQSIEGLKEMKSTAAEGHASVQLEFSAGFDNQQALTDVREKVDVAKVKLPDATDEPEVVEINVALFPVLTIALSGQIPEPSLITIARDLQDRVEALPGVLEGAIGGDRETVLEVIVDPVVMETYSINYSELSSLIRANNLLIAAGAMDTGAGRLVLKVPGVIEDLNDFLQMPLKVDGGRVITFKEIATVRRNFKDPQSFARVNGQPAVTLEIKKRVGANIIDTIQQVREIVEQERRHWPDNLTVHYMQDKSDEIRSLLSDLQNNVLSAVILVVIVIIAALGLNSALLVGLAIPGAFLATILALDTLGHTLNIVVLFSLILVVGMLVDGAIVVVELASRYMNDGDHPRTAYNKAAKRMSWPVTASAITTLAVFFPLLFWPGLVGEFMRYLPITVILALSASLAMALIFIPVFGEGIARQQKTNNQTEPSLIAHLYGKLLSKMLHHPGKILMMALITLVGSYIAYFYLGKGIEFFPDVEPEFALIQVHARGDLSVHEKDTIVRQVEQRVLGMPELESLYTRSFNSASDQNVAEDVIGILQMEFIDWDKRDSATAILERMRQHTADIPGIKLEFRKAENGPSAGKPIQIEFAARDFQQVAPVVAQVRQLMNDQGSYVDVEDDRPLLGIEWRLEVNRELAARYGANISLLGNAVQMITHGVKVADYRPDDTDDEVDIRIRFPYGERHLSQLNQLRVPTTKGLIPISHFVTVQPAPKSGVLHRVDGRRVTTIQADVGEGLLPDTQLKGLLKALKTAELDPEVSIHIKGEDEDQKEAMNFLGGAFVSAIFLMLLALVTQFNSIYQAVLVLSAIVFSTAGVLLGLLITAQPFGIVMVGIGIIALAGIVVNNNIVLIDTYNRLRRNGEDAISAALETGKRRLRPVFLTAFTTVLGLMPMVLAMNIDLINRSVSFGAPSTQWWTQLASAIAGGLSFATILTLVLTPCLLVLGDQTSTWLKAKFATK